MACSLLVFKPLWISVFPTGSQSCCPPLASSPVTNTFLCVLDSVLLGGMQSAPGPFLGDGNMKWTQVSPGVIREGTWTHSWSNPFYGRIQNLPSAFSSICQDLKLNFAAFFHCHNGWKTPPCSLQGQHVGLCSLRLSLLQSWVLPKPLSHPPVWDQCEPLRSLPVLSRVHEHPGIQGVKPGAAREYPYLFIYADALCPAQRPAGHTDPVWRHSFHDATEQLYINYNPIGGNPFLLSESWDYFFPF